LRDENHGYQLRLPTSHSIRAKTLPILLTEHGKFSGLINFPLPCPSYPINGFTISGMLVPTGEVFAFPPQLQEELLALVPDYITEVSPFDFDRDHTAGKAAYAEALFASIRARVKAAKILIDRKRWDLLMVIFTELDRIQHNFWAEMDKFHFLHGEKDPSLSSIISRTYEELDTSIGLLLDGLPKETQVLVVSDHGFGPYEKIFYLNRFLEERGFLKLKPKKDSWVLRGLIGAAARFPGVKEAYKWFYNLRQGNTQSPKIKSDPRNERQKIENWVAAELVDWKQTKAFADDYGIRINMRSREPRGIITPGKEATILLAELREQLGELKFPHNEKPVFTRVEEGKNVYRGPFVDRAPDLVTFMDVGHPHPAYREKTIFSDSPITTGDHRKEGVFIAWGKGIRQGQILRRANIVDVTPTVCYAFGTPLTPEMDGVVLDIFEEGLDAVKLSARQGSSMIKEAGQTTYTSDQESEIKRRLKSLGYLD
jgi:predicted AlkP superfamily phosphohydrolase/phosphomutase